MFEPFLNLWWPENLEILIDFLVKWPLRQKIPRSKAAKCWANSNKKSIYFFAIPV